MITTEWPTENNPSHAPFLARQVEYLRRQNAEVEVFHFKGAANPFNYLKAWWQGTKILRKKKFDLIHAQWGQSAIPVFLTSLPLVVTFRGSDLQGIANANGHYTLKGRILKFVSRMISKRADSIILVSENLSKFLPPLTKYVVIPSGLDLQLFKPRPQAECKQQLELDSQKLFILFAGSPIKKEKRYFLATKSIEILNRTVAAELFFAKDVGINKMPLYMNAADVLLLTSIHEGSPNVVKEALACNIPVVSVDVGDVKERITGIPGCFICKDEPEAIAEALQEALVKRPVSFESRKFVMSLDENIMTKKVLEVYRGVL